MAERFDLPEELTIYTVLPTRDALLVWLRHQAAENQPLEICGAGVGEVDGAGLQLLGALERTLEAQGRLWTLTQPSAALLGVAKSLGWPVAHWESTGQASTGQEVAP